MEFLTFLSQHRTPFFDAFFQATTWLAEETLVVAIICWLYWCRNKKAAYTLGFTYFISGLFVQGLKITFRIPRPWILDPSFRAVPSAIPAATGYSFPSGHTQSGTALFSTLGFFSAGRRRTHAVVFFFLAALVGFSRMYLGVHTPKDVLVSMGLTLLISFAVYHSLQPLLMHTENALRISLWLFSAVILLIIYTASLYSGKILDPQMASDAFKACGASLGFTTGYYLERKYICFTLPETTRGKILRFAAGMISVAFLMIMFKFTLTKFLTGEIVSYFLLILWIVAGYPAVFSCRKGKKTYQKNN